MQGGTAGVTPTKSSNPHLQGGADRLKMRTSKLSRDTARIVNALSPSRNTSTRRSLRTSTRSAKPSSADSVKQEDEGSESAPSTPPSETPNHQRNSTLGKRKRGIAEKHNLSDDNDDDDANKPISKRKPRRQPAKHIKGPTGALTTEAPPNWEAVYNATVAMRKRIVAPVDTMGCESLAEEHRSPRDQRLQTLISLMLSSQTKDTVTAAAMHNLQQNLPGGLCLDSLLAVEPARLNSLIEKVGFHNNKTKFIKAVAEILRDRHEGDIPDSIEGLVALPGVGPKMAYLAMSAAWGRDEGIGVDVHVHRITNLWGWHRTNSPEQTRGMLEAWLPRDKWHEINHLLVGLGQTVCLPVGRKCGNCDLSVQGLCPSAVVVNSPVKKEKRRVKVEVEGSGGAVEEAVVKVEVDDVGIKAEADGEPEGKVEVQALAGDEGVKL